MTPATFVPTFSIPLTIALALALTGAGCSTADGLGSSGSGNGSGSPPKDSAGDDGSMWNEPHPGLDDGDEDDLPEEFDCVTHRWRGYAYPIYANEAGVEVVSPGAGEPHSGVCIGTEDVSEDGHWAVVHVCGPRLGENIYGFPDEPLVAPMLEAARVKCEDTLFAEFEAIWPELDQEYEHWLGPDEGTDIFTLSRVACVPLQADNPYADYAAGSCTGYDDPALDQIEPLYNEDFEHWVACDDDPIGECVPPVVFDGAVPEPRNGDGIPAEVDACDTYRRHVAEDITVVTQGRHLTATMDSHMVDALLSLRFAACEYDRYDGTRFTEVDDWSIFAAIGFRGGDRPSSAQALANGQPIGRVYPLGRTSGQELEAFGGLFGGDRGRPDAIRIQFARGGIAMTLDLLVVAAD